MENTLQKPQRKAWLDMAKGIAIIAVLVGHSFPGSMFINKFIFSFHMPLFFIAGGFTLSVAREPVDFITNKVKKLILPYMSFLMLSALWWIVRRPITGEKHTVEAIFNHLGKQYAAGLGATNASVTWNTLAPIGPIWFIPCLFLAELVFYGVVKLCRDNDTAMFFVSVALMISGVLIAKKTYLPFSFDISLFCQILLLVGYEMKKHDLLSKKISFEGWAALVILWFVGIFVHVSMNNRQYNTVVLPVLCSVAAVFLIFRICMALEKVTIIRAPLSYYGRFSIILLLFQFWDKTVLRLPEFDPWLKLYQPHLKCYCALSVFRILFCTLIIEILRTIPYVCRCFGLELRKFAIFKKKQKKLDT